MYRIACKVSPLALYLPFFHLQRPYAGSSDVAHPKCFLWIAASSKRLLFTYSPYYPLPNLPHFLFFLHSTALSAFHCNAKANKWFCILHAFEIELTFMTSSHYVSITSVWRPNTYLVPNNVAPRHQLSGPPTPPSPGAPRSIFLTAFIYHSLTSLPYPRSVYGPCPICDRTSICLHSSSLSLCHTFIDMMPFVLIWQGAFKVRVFLQFGFRKRGNVSASGKTKMVVMTTNIFHYHFLWWYEGWLMMISWVTSVGIRNPISCMYPVLLPDSTFVYNPLKAHLQTASLLLPGSPLSLRWRVPSSLPSLGWWVSRRRVPFPRATPIRWRRWRPWVGLPWWSWGRWPYIGLPWIRLAPIAWWRPWGCWTGMPWGCGTARGEPHGLERVMEFSLQICLPEVMAVLHKSNIWFKTTYL